MNSTIQDDVISNTARQMAKDIDREVLMSAMGWHELIMLGAGRIHGARYLSVHPNNGAKWNEMMAWMIFTFGPSSEDGVWTPNMRWYANNSKFWFRDAKDRNWFILKWSS